MKQGYRNHSDGWHSIPVVVCGDHIGNPRGFRVCIDDTNSRHVDKRALVKQGVILEGVEADDEVGDQRPPFVEMARKALEGLVVLVEHLYLHAAEDDVAVGNGTGRPLREQVTCAREPGGLGHKLCLAGPRAHEQDQAAPVGDLFDDARGPAQMCGCLLEGDDVDALPDAVDVARVGRVPERGVVAHVYLRGHEEFEGDVLGTWRVEEDIGGPVPLLDPCAQLPYLLLQLLALSIDLSRLVDLAGRSPAG